MNAWKPIETAPRDGTRCWLRCRDRFGQVELKAPSGYFLHDDGLWYLIDPPTQLAPGVRPVEWVPIPMEEGK